MIAVRFIDADGQSVREVTAEPGDNLLRAGQAAGEPLEGTCEGQMACSTCHVIVSDQDFEKLPPASDEEEDMLDLAADVRRTSRLACQITLTDALDGLTVRIPAQAHNMQGR
ncbi:MAG: 2Fe-2S ferredoxin [Sphingomonas sp.]|nr:2Fe-2S ferredoxin [Sphingomonas sp.]